MKLAGKGCGLGAKGTASARPPPDHASATPLPLSWRAPVQFQSLRRGRLTFSSRSKSSCTPYHPPVQEWACEMIHNKGWRKKKMICWAFWELLEANASLSPRVCPVGSGAQSYSVQRISQTQSRSSKITSKALWTSNSVSKGGWVSVTCSQGFLTHPSDVFWTLWAVSSRSWYRICRVLVQNENAGFLGQNYWEFQDGDCTALNQRQGPFIASETLRVTSYESHTGEASSAYFLYWFLPRKVLPGLVTSITLHLRFPCHPQGPNLLLSVLFFV